MLLTIILKNGDIRSYDDNAFDDYDWRPEAFIVIKGNQWVGIYNWSEVREVNCAQLSDGDSK